MSSASITLLTNVPAPYRIPAFNCLARMLGGRLQVVFCAPAEPRRSWRFPAEKMHFDWRLLSGGSGGSGFIAQLKSAAKMAVLLKRGNASAVICGGYDSFAAWAAFLWCRLLRRRFVLWVDSTARDRRRRGVAGWCRTTPKRWMVSRADAVAASGTASAEYMRALGAEPERVFIALFSGDPAGFAREAGKVKPAEEKRRREFPNRLVLYSGRLVRAKGVFVLLEAFRSVSRDLPDAGLAVVGDGPGRSAMQEFCRQANLDRVFFEGPQEYERMPYYYALADVLALPTFSDAWGFVVNEAFACGVPAVVSHVAGTCDDLIVDGETGFAVEPGDVDGLAEKLLRILRNDDLRVRMGANCRRIIARYTPEACARGLLAAANGENPRRESSLTAANNPGIENSC